MSLFSTAASFALIVVLVALTSMPEAGEAARIVVGGPSEKWHFGFNYSDWATKAAPFYENDVLVFKFDPPSASVFPHSVVLMKNVKNFRKCNLTGARMLASPAQGGGKGFDLLLKKRKKPYYLACGQHGGAHCKEGLMKFSVKVVPAVCRG